MTMTTTKSSPIVTSEQPEKYAVIAQILNEPDMKFVKWKDLMGEGCVVRLHIRRIHFEKKLNFDDLGIHLSDEKIKKDEKSPKEAMSEIFSLGMKKLLPKAYYDRIERVEYRARLLLDTCGVKTVWGPFIPVTAYQAFMKDVAELEAEYFAARDAVLDNHRTIRKQVIKDYTVAARNAYRILNGVDKETLSEREQEREEIYLIEVRRKIRRLFPSREEILRSFAFEVDRTYIDLPRLAGDDEADDLAAPGSILDKATVEGISETEQQKLRWQQETTKERQRMMQAMNDDIVKQARKQKQERIDRFFEAVITKARGLLYETCTNVLSSIERKEMLGPRSSLSLKLLVDNLGKLNFYGDRDVERAMTLIENLLDGYDGPKEKRTVSLGQVEDTLRNIAIAMRETLLPLDYDFREEREDGNLRVIPANPTRAEVREAREELEFTIPDWYEDDERDEREEEEIEYVLASVDTDEEEERIERSS